MRDSVSASKWGNRPCSKMAELQKGPVFVPTAPPGTSTRSSRDGIICIPNGETCLFCSWIDDHGADHAWSFMCLSVCRCVFGWHLATHFCTSYATSGFQVLLHSNMCFSSQSFSWMFEWAWMRGCKVKDFTRSLIVRKNTLITHFSSKNILNPFQNMPGGDL